MSRDKAARVKLDMERVDYWLSVGAKPSDKVATLIKKVKTNSFGTAKAPAAMTAPKQPEPEAAPPEPAAEAETASEADAAPAAEGSEEPAAG